MFSIISNSNGNEYSLFKKQRLQSAYNSKQEAVRFVKSQCLPSSTKKPIIFIFGVTTGALLEATLEQKYKQYFCFVPESNAIIFHLKEKYRLLISNKKVILIPTSKCFIPCEFWNNFFEDNLISTNQFTTLDWEPVIKNSPALYQLQKGLITWLKRDNASRTTESYFFNRWFTNSLTNSRYFSTRINLQHTNSPIIITAAGMGLKQQIPYLKANRHKFVLLALSASVSALIKCNIIPDIIIQTDPGYWSGIITAKALTMTSKKPYLMMPFTACPLNNNSESKVVQINQNNSFDEIIGSKSYSRLSIMETGSAACSALLVAQRLTTNKIYFCGLDLQSDKEMHHVESHLSISILNRSANKINSLQNRLYSQYQSQHPTALSIFYDWFYEMENKSKQFYRLESITGKKSQRSISLIQFEREMQALESAIKLKIETEIKIQPNEFKLMLDNLEYAIKMETKLYKAILNENFKKSDLPSKKIAKYLLKIVKNYQLINQESLNAH